jgi:hypothetical protein
MAGTIRNNGDNSSREIKRAEITRARRAAQAGRRELRALDDRALRGRAGR